MRHRIERTGIQIEACARTVQVANPQVVVSSAIRIVGSERQSLLPGESTIQSKAADDLIEPSGNVATYGLVSAKRHIPVAGKHECIGPVIVARAPAYARINRKIIRLMCQRSRPGVMRQ